MYPEKCTEEINWSDSHQSAAAEESCPASKIGAKVSLGKTDKDKLKTLRMYGTKQKREADEHLMVEIGFRSRLAIDPV